MDPNYPGMDEAEPSEAPSDGDSDMKGKDADKDGETALLPKSFFEGQSLKPGDQFYVEVVRSYEDEIEVKYGKKESMSEEKSPDDKLSEMGSDNPGKMMGGGY
jgi:hypothetical protein